MIHFVNVSKRFDKSPVLEDIEWTLNKGSVIGLVGPNGSGKSTLLRLISGVISPDAGIVKIDGADVQDNPAVKEKVFFLSDDPYFFNQSSIDDMRKFYRLFYKNFDDTHYQQLLQVFKLDPSAKINSFSKGMKRQVMLILALASRPQILLLDEAFDGLDPIMRFKLRQLISEEISTSETLVIISSHNLRELEDICDSVAMINNHQVQINQTTQDYHDQYHKFQVVFKEDTDKKVFSHLNPLNISGSTKIFTLILKGDETTLSQQLHELDPLLVEHSNATLEEVFIYEMEDQ